MARLHAPAPDGGASLDAAHGQVYHLVAVYHPSVVHRQTMRIVVRALIAAATLVLAALTGAAA